MTVIQNITSVLGTVLVRMTPCASRTSSPYSLLSGSFWWSVTHASLYHLSLSSCYVFSSQAYSTCVCWSLHTESPGGGWHLGTATPPGSPDYLYKCFSKSRASPSSSCPFPPRLLPGCRKTGVGGGCAKAWVCLARRMCLTFPWLVHHSSPRGCSCDSTSFSEHCSCSGFMAKALA